MPVLLLFLSESKLSGDKSKEGGRAGGRKKRKKGEGNIIHQAGALFAPPQRENDKAIDYLSTRMK